MSDVPLFGKFLFECWVYQLSIRSLHYVSGRLLGDTQFQRAFGFTSNAMTTIDSHGIYQNRNIYSVHDVPIPFSIISSVRVTYESLQ